MTTKRPFADISLANEPTWFDPDDRFEAVICVKYASGVDDEVD
jgi:hypothetical protein